MNGGGHLSAGWKMPDNSLNRLITGEFLSTFKDKQDQVISLYRLRDKKEHPADDPEIERKHTFTQP